MAQRFFIETLGCPKNAVDSDKVTATLLADGLVAADTPEEADLVVVNTCAFIEAARQESIDTVLALSDRRCDGARIVVTGCMAERYGDELAEALPEVDAVIGFSGEGDLASVLLGRPSGGVRDLLDLPRPAPRAPWAYVKIAEGCDRACAFCAIPSFRGAQRSRTPDSIFLESKALVEGGAYELVLVAQDLASYGRDTGNPGALAPLLRDIDELRADGLQRVRLLYLYPSEVRDPLISTMLELDSVVPYFDLSLQHASAPLLRRMKRWGNGDKFLKAIDGIRAAEPEAAFRSSFIVGFPGETEQDHSELLDFLGAASLDWAGLFAFSPEEGTAALTLDRTVDDETIQERLRECSEVQDPITAALRDSLVGMEAQVLIDSTEGGDAVGRTHREAPEIDGVVRVSEAFARPGALITVRIREAIGPDLIADPVRAGVSS
ncbi:MAG: 30S ribosomal protein S12 methylthiotransferase RimO [Acidimicrobiia bacterium]|nr:30S ribosomal protein S12 methylthiotransferase RimO [Acidimicrobiia bacterium]MBJ7512967.1 30S ribosomal protein S12 methylthiotransferase RimO [Acidimicrobiia bacterium]